MFCPHCNAYLEKKSKFCPECAADLSNVQFESISDIKQETASATTKDSMRKKYYIIGGLVFVLFLFLLYGPNSNTPKDSILHTETPTDKITESTYDNITDKIENVSLNESFSEPVIAEITIKSTEFTDKVIPTNPSSFYTY